VIYLRNTTRKHALRPRAVKRAAQRLLDALGESRSSISLSFVGDAAMRRLNRQHRSKDAATDVLSFPLLETFSRPRRSASAPERMLGDIVVSVDTAARQAAAYGAPLGAEIERLLIHGLLHLLGHDHEAAAERARMQREERRLACAIGLAWPY